MPMLSRRAFAALAALVVAIPTAEAGAPSCSIPDVEDWREYRSAHFALATDVSAKRAASLVAELEKLHALVRAALFGEGVDVPGRFRVVAFASPRHFEKHAPPNTAAFVKTGLLGEPLIVFPFEGNSPVPETVAHEIAHLVSYFQFPRQPRWFAEGLAIFVSSVARERTESAPALGSHIVRGAQRGGGRWAGLASPEILQYVASSLHVGAKELLEWTGATHEGDPGGFHAASWMLYHWLWNQRSRQLTAYQERLAAGEAPAEAWHAAFPEWDPARPGTLAALEDALALYRKGGRYASYRVEAKDVDPSFTETALAPAELHVLLADARGRWPDDRAERDALLRRELDEALREDATQPVAISWGAELRSAPPAAALRAATAARPGDYRAWLLLADALDASSEAAEREAALRKAAALEPGSARANNSLAWLLVSSGRAREARPFADRALDLAPWDPTIVDTLAAVAMGIGQCKAAVALQRRAADHYPPADPGGDGFRERLADYEARCAPSAPAAK
jgi:hypothetical protein